MAINKQEQLEETINKMADHEIVELSNLYDDAVHENRHIFSMDDFDDVFAEYTPSQIARMVHWGRYNPADMWFRIKSTGEIMTYGYPPCDVSDIEVIAEYLIENNEDFGFAEIRHALDNEIEEY